MGLKNHMFYMNLIQVLCTQ